MEYDLGVSCETCPRPFAAVSGLHATFLPQTEPVENAEIVDSMAIFVPGHSLYQASIRSWGNLAHVLCF